MILKSAFAENGGIGIANTPAYFKHLEPSGIQTADMCDEQSFLWQACKARNAR